LLSYIFFREVVKDFSSVKHPNRNSYFDFGSRDRSIDETRNDFCKILISSHIYRIYSGITSVHDESRHRQTVFNINITKSKFQRTRRRIIESPNFPIPCPCRRCNRSLPVTSPRISTLSPLAFPCSTSSRSCPSRSSRPSPSRRRSSFHCYPTCPCCACPCPCPSISPSISTWTISISTWIAIVATSTWSVCCASAIGCFFVVATSGCSSSSVPSIAISIFSISIFAISIANDDDRENCFFVETAIFAVSLWNATVSIAIAIFVDVANAIVCDEIAIAFAIAIDDFDLSIANAICDREIRSYFACPSRAFRSSDL